MAKQSAGLVLYRIAKETLEVLLVHPGGPYWTKKDAGAWFIPKGEINPGEDPQDAAKREFEEETGMKPKGSPESSKSSRRSIAPNFSKCQKPARKFIPRSGSC